MRINPNKAHFLKCWFLKKTPLMGIIHNLSVTGGELFEDIVAREFYSEADARWVILVDSFWWVIIYDESFSNALKSILFVTVAV